MDPPWIDGPQYMDPDLPENRRMTREELIASECLEEMGDCIRDEPEHPDTICLQTNTIRQVLESKLREHADNALAFLIRACDGKHRIVNSGDLTLLQIADAQAEGRFYTEPGGGLGWALLPWNLQTAKDQQRVQMMMARPKAGASE